MEASSLIHPNESLQITTLRDDLLNNSTSTPKWNPLYPPDAIPLLFSPCIHCRWAKSGEISGKNSGCCWCWKWLRGTSRLQNSFLNAGGPLANAQENCWLGGHVCSMQGGWRWWRGWESQYPNPGPSPWNMQCSPPPKPPPCTAKPPFPEWGISYMSGMQKFIMEEA